MTNHQKTEISFHFNWTSSNVKFLFVATDSASAKVTYYWCLILTDSQQITAVAMLGPSKISLATGIKVAGVKMQLKAFICSTWWMWCVLVIPRKSAIERMANATGAESSQLFTCAPSIVSRAGALGSDATSLPTVVQHRHTAHRQN